jgi:hypothetical protein
MGGVGAKPTAWAEAEAAFLLLAHNPAPNKAAVAIKKKKGFRATGMTESPDLYSPELLPYQHPSSASVRWNHPSKHPGIMNRSHSQGVDGFGSGSVWWRGA